MKIETQLEYERMLHKLSCLRHKINEIRKYKYERFHFDEVNSLPDLEREFYEIRRAIADVEMKVDRKFF